MSNAIEPTEVRRRHGLPAILTIIVTLLGIVAFMAPAQAVDDYPYGTADQVDRWGFYTRNCTSYVAWRMERNGVAFSNNMTGPNGTQGHWGNAYEWDNNALRIGYPTDTRPAVGAVAQWNEWESGALGAGHVAYVERVNSDGSVLVSEYNWASAYAYSERTVRAPRYIHIKDLTASDTTAPSVSWASPVSNGGTRDVSSGAVTLEASASDNVGVTRVKFFRWDAVGNRWLDIATVSSAPWRTSIDVGSLNPDYNQINVQAWDAANNASSSPYIWLRKAGTVPSAPTNLSASASGSSVTVRWTDASSNESGFRIYRWNGSGWVEIATTGANATSFTDNNLSPGTWYHTVCAYNGTGQNCASGYSTAQVSSSRNEVVVDQTSSGFSRNGCPYWYTAPYGYGGSTLWTYVNGSVVSCSAAWSATLGGGNYEVYVFVPRSNATTRNARYEVLTSSGTVVRSVNQNAYYDAWVSLGTYSFGSGTAQRVRLADNTGEAPSTYYQIAFDATRFTPR